MALLSNQETKQQKMILILVAVIVITISVVYFGFIRSKSSIDTNIDSGIGAEMNGVGSVSGGDINVDFLFFEDPRFQDLKKYGDWPIQPGKTGRSNPFKPLDANNIKTVIEEDELSDEEIETKIEELTLEELLQLLGEDLELNEGTDLEIKEDIIEENIEENIVEEIDGEQ